MLCRVCRKYPSAMKADAELAKWWTKHEKFDESEGRNISE